MLNALKHTSTAKFVLIGVMAIAAIPAPGQAPAAHRGPRTADGKPNLNGIWQALNTGNWDILTHGAQAGNVPTLGAAGAMPPGMGVVEGDAIPHLPAAAAQKKDNFAKRGTADPELKCYLPGVPRATYMPYPFQILQSASALTFVYEYAGAVRNVFLKDPGPAPAD